MFTTGGVVSSVVSLDERLTRRAVFVEVLRETVANAPGFAPSPATSRSKVKRNVGPSLSVTVRVAGGPSARRVGSPVARIQTRRGTVLVPSTMSLSTAATGTETDAMEPGITTWEGTRAILVLPPLTTTLW